MRDTELYKVALRSMLWQRDNYLVGGDYADERSAQRRKQKQMLETHQLRCICGSSLFSNTL